MDLGNGKSLLTTAVVFTLLGAPLAAGEPQFPRGARDRSGWQLRQGSEAFTRGYQDGLRRGETDARAGRSLDYTRDKEYRKADRGYNRRDGDKDAYRDVYRRGFAEGYRDGFDRVRVQNRRTRDRFPDGVRGRRGVGGRYAEPAAARGYSDGYEQGLEDGDDGDRYDPVRHSDYREADQGYYGDYGSKDAYKNNYRSGFRQGYEDGYREGSRRR